MAREAARPVLDEQDNEAGEAAKAGRPKRPDDFHSSFSAEESLAEFRELATSAGATVVGELLQKRDKADPATLVGKGKLEEIAGAAASSNADVILFDHDLTPSQQRNIERELKMRVIDRTQLILDIFAKHARTREGQLQVELAQLEYMLPRLAGRGVEMSQLGGGIGTRGPGETQLETDRRKIYRRIRHIKEQVEEVRRIRAQQRQRREAVPVATVALVGYTNAGKSTLFNALTKSEVTASSRMFATLDPTIRSIVLPSKRKVLFSDTVGFIRNLPHTLVTSFRATLEEVQRAELVLHVVDAASPEFIAAEQKSQVEKVLEELEAQAKPRLLVRNKIDLLSESEINALRDVDGVVNVSALKGEGLERLLLKIDEVLTGDPVVTVKLKIPQSEGKALALIEGKAKILSRNFRAGNVYVKVQTAESLLRGLKKFLIE
ncbi:MAG TPA: GTPase HflX [Terriglobales bacterium]|nr:GTPase HflX [Terriglobales bacterium]